MSKLGLGINGFGRIGRMVLRASLHRSDIEIKASATANIQFVTQLKTGRITEYRRFTVKMSYLLH